MKNGSSVHTMKSCSRAQTLLLYFCADFDSIVFRMNGFFCCRNYFTVALIPNFASEHLHGELC